MKKDFEQLPHTADIKIRVFGDTKEELFANAVIGMFQVIRPQIDGCRIAHDRVVCDTLPIQHQVEVRSFQEASLLVDFLSEALYLSDIHNEAYLHVDVHELRDTFISATLHGIQVQGFEVVEIKAVTYHELEIKKVNGAWQADIVFDI
ncbi:MAG TPA: archease [Candidatus Dependentiae bacterium]|nr:archease [Candidatus Dependentiae bacterium]HRQ62738.1 archease [Candidatus Dependentiae bacterium]